MKGSFPSEDTIRQYLLGRFDAQDELENSLSQQILFDDELPEIVDSIADEIIEDYLDGTLNAPDKKAVEEYFLRPSERKEKLQLARLLRHHFEVQGKVQAETQRDIWPGPVPPVMNDGTGGALILAPRSYFRTYGQFALLVLLSVSAFIYLARVRQGLQSQIAASQKIQRQLEGDLAQERERSANLTKQLQELQPPVVTLAFLGDFRGQGDAREVKIMQYTERIHVEVKLRGAPANAYNVRLETPAGERIWSQTGLKPSSGGLRFEMPRKGITTGPYCLLVNPLPGHLTKRYCFRAKIIQ